MKKLSDRLVLSARSNVYHYTKDVLNVSKILEAKFSNSNKRINAFWWSDILNFGDLFTPDIVKALGYIPIRESAQQSDIVGVGSILGAVPENYKGTILGSGIISPNTDKRYPNAHFAAARGELTKQVLGLSPKTPTGDFGILASKMYGGKQKKYKVGLVPHYVDRFNPWVYRVKQRMGSDCLIIDVQDTPKTVSKKISQCEVVVSSSMHGIIVADSYNIPNVWIQLSDKVIGDGFKFHDYNSSINCEQECQIIKSVSDVLNFDKVAVLKEPKTIERKIDELWQIAEKEFDVLSV